MPSVANTSAPDPKAHARALGEVAKLRADADKQSILADFGGPYTGAPAWDQVQAAQFPAAFEQGSKLWLAEVDAIAFDPAPPTFENTIAAFEGSGRHQSRAQTLFSVLTSNLNTAEVQAVDKEWAPKLAAVRDQITFNALLFARIEAVYAARRSSGLSAAQIRLTERRREDFVHQGALLDPAQKRELSRINQALAGLFTDFGNKVLAEEKAGTLLERESDLEGLPDGLRQSFRAAAEASGKSGKWFVANTRSSVDPFLAASARRDLRERVWKLFKNRGDNGGENDTNAALAKIVELRAGRAALLGYPSHAHWQLSDTMAKDPGLARELMLRVWGPALARVREEVADMAAVAHRHAPALVIEPWDYLYYGEAVRKQKYSLDQKEISRYFELDHMIAAAFWMGGRLYQLQFEEITGQVAVFHPDVRVWHVTAKDGAHVGLFYGDYFARPEKRSGAWAATYRRRESFTGEVTSPITSNNNNFAAAKPGSKVLISLDDAETLFHEFGHALHALLSEVEYPSFNNTPRDFVEYPSQVHEAWVLSREVLDRFARDVRTDEPMPKALVDKVMAARKFNQGYQTVEYLSAAIVDMELHTRADGVIEPDSFERETLSRIGAPKEVAMRHRLPQFSHLFSSDAYSAGYYSYLWSEVMDADTRQAFIEAGDDFDPATAAGLRKHILAPGNTTDRADAYRQFRGRDPDVKALLEKRGFASANGRH